MPAATNILKMVTSVGEAPAAAVPGDAELFANLLQVGLGEGDGTVATDARADASVEQVEETGSETIATDPAALLPILDQQRLASVAPMVTNQVPSHGGDLPAGAETSPGAPAAATRVGQGTTSGQGESKAAPAGEKPIASDTGAKTGTPNALPADVPASEVDQPHDGSARPVLAKEAGSAPPSEAAGPARAPTAPQKGAVEAVAHAVTGTSQAAALAPLVKEAIQPSKPGEARSGAPKAEAKAGASISPAPGKQAGEPAPLSRLRVAAADAVPTVDGSITEAPAASKPPATAWPLNIFSQQPAGASAPGQAQPSMQNIGASLAAQVLDMARGGEWIDQLARDISRAASSDGAMRFRLSPETLGELRVEITQSERGAHIRLNVTSEAAHQALADAQPKLIAEARAQGVRIAEAEISFAGGQSHGREAGRNAQTPSEIPTPRGPRGTQSDANSDAARPAARLRTDRYA